MTTPNPKSSEVKAMSDDELRIAVAELRGWKFAPANGPLDLPWRHPTIPAWDSERGFWAGRAPLPPDYPRDLNAMHEAILSLDAEQSRHFIYVLDRVVSSSAPTNEGRWQEFHRLNATARQRALAFVLTLTESNAQRGEK